MAGLLATIASGVQLEPICLETIGLRSVVQANPQLDGSTVTVGLVELCQQGDCAAGGYAFMPNFEHVGLSQVRLRGLYYYDNPDRPVCYSQHASSIAGLLFGNDTAAQASALGDFAYRGIVPNASLELYEANWFLYRRVMGGLDKPVAADVLSCSWGTVSDDPLTLFWQRGVDAFVERHGCVVVAGAGNGGEGSEIRKPSWGSNVISVGTANGLGEFPDRLRYVGGPLGDESCFGPTDDARCKPDIIAVGLTVGPRPDSTKDYYSSPGPVGYSSFATAQVAGVAGLLIDAARQYQFEGADDVRVVKALLLNGADKLLGWHRGYMTPDDDADWPLDFRQGAGLLDATNSFNQLIAGRYDPIQPAEQGWDLNTVALAADDPNWIRVYPLAGTYSANTTLQATIVWLQHYQQGGVFTPAPHARLSLELWSLDKQGRLSEQLDYCASPRDTVGHIYWQSDRSCRLALVVRGLSGPVKQYETFGLAYALNQKNWIGDQLPADINRDGIVNVDDILQWTWEWDKWHGTGPYYNEYPFWLPEDVNCDGTIDTQDFALISTQWLQRSPWYAEP